MYVGAPSADDLYCTALPVTRISMACKLGKSLPLDDDVIFRHIDVSDEALLQNVTRQLLDRGKKDKLRNLLHIYDVKDAHEGTMFNRQQMSFFDHRFFLS